MENMNELIAAIETMDPEAVASAILAFTGLFVIIAAIALIRYLMTAIGYSKMYRKAGEAGWKAFIPVFNTYNNYKISWNGKFFFLYAALVIASSLRVFNEGALALLGTAYSIAIIYIGVKQNIKMAKLFGKGAGTGIALILFPGITSLILGLGKAEFQGNLLENN